MPLLTVFTPAYNRAHTIGRTYESLCRQTCKDFCWLIIDDGSTDNTRELVASWLGCKPTERMEGESGHGFRITYIWQANQGMHGAHNTAYRNITTELNTCIDSDDWMPDNAVERIVDFWSAHGSNRYAGLVGLDQTADGKVIGTAFELSEVDMTSYYDHGGQGDKKLVYRTEVINQYPEYPLFEGERYVSLATKYFMIDQEYPLLTLNVPLVTVEYQQDGSSLNMWRQYWRNPQGFIYDRKLVLSHKPPLKKRFKYCAHYISSKLIARQYDIISDSPCRISTLLMLPFGLALYLLIRYKVRQGAAMKISQ